MIIIIITDSVIVIFVKIFPTEKNIEYGKLKYVLVIITT